MIAYMVDKILNYKLSDRKKIDRLLELDATMYCNLGIESSKNERREVKKQSKIIYRAIKTINKDLGNSLLQAMD